MSSFMILCLLILADVILGRPVGHLTSKLVHINWSEQFANLFGKDCHNLKDYAIRVGRMTAQPLVTFYYVVRSTETTLMERILIFAAIAYVLSPSLVSKRIFSFLGLLDDGIAISYVLNKIADKITPTISAQVESTLDAWFGAEVVAVIANA